MGVESGIFRFSLLRLNLLGHSQIMYSILVICLDDFNFNLILIKSVTLLFPEPIKSLSFFFPALLISSGSYITSTRY